MTKLEQRNYLESILLSDNVEEALEENLDEVLKIIPEIKYMIGFPHKHPHHHLDVWNHTILSVSLSPKSITIRLALLLHDIGKPFSYEEGEIRHYPNHPEVSAIMARNILEDLEYDRREINLISELIKYHDTPIDEEKLKRNQDFYRLLYYVQKSDALSHHPEKLEKRKIYLKQIKDRLQIKESSN